MIRKILTFTLAFATYTISGLSQEKPDTMWFKFDDRFVQNEIISLVDIDSLQFNKQNFKMYKYLSQLDRVLGSTKAYKLNGVYRFDEIERHLVKPSQYSSIDFTNENSQFCFQRSVESEHFVLFWAKGLTRQSNGTPIPDELIE